MVFAKFVSNFGSVHKQHARASLNATRLAMLALLSTVALASGCGKAEKTIPQLPVVPVSGKVTFDGQAPAGAQLVLHGSGAATGVTAQATVSLDGTYQVGTYSTADGAPEGDYVVTVQWFRINSDGAAGPNVIPRQYTQPDTSPVKVKVGSAATTLEPIAINAR